MKDTILIKLSFDSVEKTLVIFYPVDSGWFGLVNEGVIAGNKINK